MKCPKCNFASFEYLNSCKKCGNDLTLHKTEMGIDYPQYNTLGLMAILRHEASPQAAVAEPAALVEDQLGAEQLSETSTTEQMSGTSGFEAAIGSDTDFTNIGGGVDLMGTDDLDLSGLGESADETASINLPSMEEEEINIGAEITPETPKPETPKNEVAETSKKPAYDGLDGIEFDASVLEESATTPENATPVDLGEIEEAVAPPVKEDEFAIDMGDLDLGPTAAESHEPPAAKEAVADIDIGNLEDIEIATEEKPAAAPKQAAPAAPSSDFNMDGFDLDINLDDIDFSDTGKKEEPKKDDKKKDDKDNLDIDLSDLKLD